MAIEVFKEASTEVELLRSLALDAGAEESNALCRAAVVLLVSHFEAFLKIVAEEFVDGVSTGQLEARKLPRGLKEAHTLPKLEEIVSSKDDTQRLTLLKRLDQVTVLWRDESKPPPGSLQAATFRRLVTSSNKDVIDDLFARMGHKNNVCDGDLEVTNDTGETIDMNIDYALRDVVTCRNNIAHGKGEIKPTPDDVARYLLFLSAFAERLQRKATALCLEVVS